MCAAAAAFFLLHLWRFTFARGKKRETKSNLALRQPHGLAYFACNGLIRIKCAYCAQLWNGMWCSCIRITSKRIRCSANRCDALGHIRKPKTYHDKTRNEIKHFFQRWLFFRRIRCALTSEQSQQESGEVEAICSPHICSSMMFWRPICRKKWKKKIEENLYFCLLFAGCVWLGKFSLFFRYFTPFLSVFVREFSSAIDNIDETRRFGNCNHGNVSCPFARLKENNKHWQKKATFAYFTLSFAVLYFLSTAAIANGNQWLILASDFDSTQR